MFMTRLVTVFHLSLIFVIAFLFFGQASQASAATWYVRPDNDGNGTDLNYGSEDGTSLSNAFDGFADISGIAAGDTVCLPGGDEPFFERLDTGTAGTLGNPVTYKGCGSTQALIWSAQGLSGNRSFDVNRVATSTAAYVWDTVATDIYRKKIDVRPRMLWENDTWLQPIDINAASEATILATLTSGQWGVKDNGDSTYRIYYKSTISANNPTNTVIRADNIPISGASLPNIVRVDVNNITLENIGIRGHTATSQARALGIYNSSNIILRTITFTRSEIGPGLHADASAISNVLFDDVSVLYSSNTGAYIQGGNFGVTDLTIDGGSYSNSLASTYNGSGFTAGDGDGIGIGQAGGLLTNIVIKNITADNNNNYGVYVGTSYSMTVTNFSLLTSTMSGNRGCFGEGVGQVATTLTIAGLLCLDSTNAPVVGPAIDFTNPPAARTVTVANTTFSGNLNPYRILFRPHANNNYQFRNLIFIANPGQSSSDYGDFYSNNVALVGDEVFSSIYFYSLPNLDRRFARLGAAGTPYVYNSSTDLAAFNAATGATNTFLNVDPLLTSSSNFRLLSTSPLIDSGTSVSLTTDYLGNPIYGAPDIGAYEYQPPYTFASNNLPTTGSARLYSDGKYRMTAASSTSSVADFSVTPSGGSYYTASTSQYMDITINTWETTGDKNKGWTATSTTDAFNTQATSTVYTAGDLVPSTYYTFKLDGIASTTAITNNGQCTDGVCLSDASGNLTFTYVGGYSTHTFNLIKNPDESVASSRAGQFTPSEQARRVALMSTPVADVIDQVPGVTTFNFTSNLALGARGQDVVELQDRLRTEGYFDVDSTGYFGLTTYGAVRAYQRAHGIADTGFVGPITRAMLNTSSSLSASSLTPEEKQLAITQIRTKLAFLIQQLIVLLQQQVLNM